jgi:hypothetical protein
MSNNPDVVAACAAVAAVRGRHHDAASLYREAARLYRSVAASMPGSLGETLYVALANHAENMADHYDNQAIGGDNE